MNETFRVGPWTLVGVAAIAWVAAIAIAINRITEPLAITDAMWGLSFLGLSAVGAVVVSRQRGNGFGWALLLGSVGIALGVMASDYATRIGEGTATWPGGIWVFLAGETIFPMALALLLAAFHRFPDGEVLAGGGWPFADRLIRILVGIIGALVLFDRTPGLRVDDWPDPDIFRPNPLTRLVPLPELDAVSNAVMLMVLALGLLGFVSLFVRYRRGSVTVRAQLRWVLLPVVTGIGLLTPTLIYDALVVDPLPPLIEVLVTMVFTIGIPVGIFMAITKTGLYEIDRLIRRTVAYSIVTTVLVAVYAAAVLGVGQVMAWFGATGNDVIVALSTLVAAALARPLLTSVRRAIDQRFHRAGRDAERIVDAFRGQLRDDVSDDSVREGLVDAVKQTLAPQFVAIWVREPASTGSSTS